MRIHTTTKARLASLLIASAMPIASAAASCGSPIPTYADTGYGQLEFDSSRILGGKPKRVSVRTSCDVAKQYCGADGFTPPTESRYDRHGRLVFTLGTTYHYKGRSLYPTRSEFGGGTRPETTTYIRNRDNVIILKKKVGFSGKEMTYAFDIRKNEDGITSIRQSPSFAVVRFYRNGELIASEGGSIMLQVTDGSAESPTEFRKHTCKRETLSNGNIRWSEYVSGPGVREHLSEMTVLSAQGIVLAKWHLSWNTEEAARGLGSWSKHFPSVDVDTHGNPTRTRSCAWNPERDVISECVDKIVEYEFW